MDILNRLAYTFATVEFHYRGVNVSTPVEIGSRPTVGDSLVDGYEPRTALGRKLIELRRAYILGGGKLLSQDEVLEEVRRNRGEFSEG